MRFAMKPRLRRIAAGLLATIAAAGSLVVSSAAPASADTYTSWRYLFNYATKHCLATDFSTSVYTFTGCDGPQRWRQQKLDAYPGTFMLQNEATGRCLKQQDFYRVISGSCDGSKVEFRWEASSEYSWVWSANTYGLLVTDFTHKVSLYNSATAPTNQGWFWKGTAGPPTSASASPAMRLVL
ncbi:hypothetical protein [Micromonospora sp. NPDC005979]|uniref:hypothetical protein n=1 Tax=Micromonospora sp. NPDC005979 TaxID=3156726 RepID=UPI0033AB69A7